MKLTFFLLDRDFGWGAIGFSGVVAGMSSSGTFLRFLGLLWVT